MEPVNSFSFLSVEKKLGKHLYTLSFHLLKDVKACRVAQYFLLVMHCRSQWRMWSFITPAARVEKLCKCQER